MQTGTQAEKDNCLCWMCHYLDCHAPSETCNGHNCPDDDPFGGH